MKRGAGRAGETHIACTRSPSRPYHVERNVHPDGRGERAVAGPNDVGSNVHHERAGKREGTPIAETATSALTSRSTRPPTTHVGPGCWTVPTGSSLVNATRVCCPYIDRACRRYRTRIGRHRRCTTASVSSPLPPRSPRWSGSRVRTSAPRERQRSATRQLSRPPRRYAIRQPSVGVGRPHCGRDDGSR